MHEFIQMAIKQLGIDEQQAKSATSGVLGLLQKHAPADAFSGVMNSVPGASDLLKGLGGNPGASSGGGALGGLFGAASSALGGVKQGGSSILDATKSQRRDRKSTRMNNSRGQGGRCTRRPL